mgnify:FL=1
MRLLLRWCCIVAALGGAIASRSIAAESQSAGTGSAAGQAPATLEEGFHQPPPSARPWVYWFWLNGNITAEGITADLEAMQRVGIGGVLIMEVDQGVPEGKVGFMSDAWQALFRHAVKEAARLGLEVNMNNDAGWNGSGGPWIQPEQSMQKVVFSEIEAAGPRHLEVRLPQPETVAGYYRDIAVLAFPSPGPYRIENIRGKAAFEIGHAGGRGKEPPAGSAIQQAQIVDLSSRMDPAGRLVWDVPAGRWTVVRFGHTSTGVQNAPAPASGRGLECDKLSPEGVEANFRGMMARLIAGAGPAAGKTLVATHVDSWENGSQNWTARMREEFRKRRGYDLLPFLPVLTGRVVDGLDISERFLWDLRRTASELVVENYAGHLRELAHRHGLRFTIEAYGSPCDHLAYAGQCDEPMGEFWVGGGAMNTCKGMASAAHIYGKPIVGAEAFTATDQERWRDHPASVKALGDIAFCEGINRFVVHRYAMQPWLDRRPGMTMGPWGLHYERTQTWWDLTPGWHQYLARCQYLLRQGRFVADIAYLEPEDSPQGFHDHPRQGYDWDQINAEALFSRVEVKDGRLVLPDGLSYRLLVLPETRVMTPRLAERIKELVQAGATVVGPRPLRSPSLTDFPECDAQVDRIAREVWGDCDGQRVLRHRLGKGQVVWGITPEKLLAESGVPPDVRTFARLRWIHRRAGDTDIYFVANPTPQWVSAAVGFRVRGKPPEFWHPESGRIEPAPMFLESEGTTRVFVTLGPSESVFVVFRPQARRIDPAVALLVGGKPLATVSELAPRITVEKASYGVPGDPARSRDVRQEVAAKLAAGQYRFPVTDMAAGGDPADQVVKTLEVQYTYQDRRFTVRARDGDFVHINPEVVTIVVEKALYGVLDDPKRTRDVKALVQRWADAGESSFPVARLAAGDDPAFGIVKTLVLEYSLGGQAVRVRATDPDTVVLAQVQSAPPPAHLVVDGAGQVRLRAGQPGEYEIRFASGKALKHSVALGVSQPVEIAGPWEVTFPQAAGLFGPIRFDRLVSWSDRPEPLVKFFSGTAVYRTRFTGAETLRQPGHRVLLDLGNVQVIARVRLNGQDLGVWWRPPFVRDVTDLLAGGDNRLEVEVTNLWPNRMIGDEHLPEDSPRNPNGTLKQWPDWLLAGKPSPTGRHTFATWRLWKKSDQLLESGLLGPVRLRAVACP